MSLLDFDEEEKREMRTIDYKLVDSIVKLLVVGGVITYLCFQEKDNFDFKHHYTPKTEEYFDSIRLRQDSVLNNIEYHGWK